MREKLIELLETVVSPKELLCYGDVLVSTSRVADHLIANGVTFSTEIEELKTDNERLRDMWAKAVSDASKAKSKESRWIPVTERLPEKYGEYIVAVREETNEMHTDYADYDPYHQKWKTGLFLGVRDKVTHWMPLPEPPKEG